MNSQQTIASIPRWRHRINVGNGVVTPGSQDTFAQLDTLGLPNDLTGFEVLDVGCSDGFFSFECERRGAKRVLAVDNFSSVYIDEPKGFWAAHKLLESKVEFLQSDIFDLDPGKVGQFDLVLFLGVLYHLRHPLLAMEKLAALTKDRLILETEIAPAPSGLRQWIASKLAGAFPVAYMEFYAKEEINRDPTTWWAPTTVCAEAMLQSCGFCGVKTVYSKFGRGVFHASSPKNENDAEQLIAQFGTDPVSRVCASVLNSDVSSADLASTLKGCSITKFAKIRQLVAEARSKQWHQVDRWKHKI